MNALPETSSLFSIFSRGALSRAHVERLGTEFATEQARGTAGGWPPCPGDAPIAVGVQGRILRSAFLHDGRLILALPSSEGGVVRCTNRPGTDAVTDVMRELRALGEPAAGQFFLNAWLEESGSFDVLPAVRTALAGAGELDGRRLASPRLLITHGLSGSGKTTLATALAGCLDAIVLRQDTEVARIRSSNGGRASEDLPAGALASRLEELASRALRAGWAVIVESCFLLRRHRRAFQMVAADHRVPFTILDCRAPLPLIRKRLERRLAFGALFGGTDGDLVLVERKLQEQLQNLEPLEGMERRHAVHVDTGENVYPEPLAARIQEEP